MAKSTPQHDYLPACGHDRLLPFYDLLTTFLGVRAVHRAQIEAADLGSAQRVLDIGCGTGNLTLLAKRAHPDVELTGLDPDPLALARATRKAGGTVRFDQGYSQSLPYADGSFDRVLSALMLHHVAEEQDRIATLVQARRVLRPGGWLCLLDMGGGRHEHGWIGRRHGHLHQAADAIPDQMRAAGFGEVRELFRRKTWFGPVVCYRAG